MAGRTSSGAPQSSKARGKPSAPKLRAGAPKLRAGQAQRRCHQRERQADRGPCRALEGKTARPSSRPTLYVVPVDDHAPLEDRPLRVAIIQPMRPRRDEIDAKDPLHWTPRALAEHRRHLAEVCRLAHQKLKTWASAGAAASGKGEESSPIVDVVLFPELAVHPEHVSLLRRLSDKLRANIFTGLTLLHSSKAGGVVNQGLWLIRTDSPGHGRSFQYVRQGKRHPTKLEVKMGVKGYRPHVTLVDPVKGRRPEIKKIQSGLLKARRPYPRISSLRGRVLTRPAS